MARPRIKNGYVRIVNELLEAIIAYPFTGRERNVLLTILRLTYGWKGQKNRQISVGEIARLTRYDRRNARKALQALQDHGAIFIQHTTADRSANVLGINKNYESWKYWTGPNCGKPVDTL